jgi:glycosyltransferase involved in cell wall biosynthesis
MNSVSKVLFVIDSLDYSGRARQLTHLAAGLPRERFSVRVCVLGGDAPWGDELRARGVRVDVLNWRRVFDVKPLWDLRALIRTEAPDVIHAWGLKVVTALVVAGGCRPGRLLVSAALPGRDTWRWPARWLLPRVKRVIALGEAEAEGYRRLGVRGEQMAVVPPGVPVPDALPTPASLTGLPADARVILCLGPILRHKGHRDAAWALNILQLLHANLHLVILGSGAGLGTIRRLVAANDLGRHVHLVGPVADVSGWLAGAELVWVPSLRPSGRYAVLEAMAAGRPVVASRLPGLTELVAEGQTGDLFMPGDKADLCRKSRRLLDYPDHAARMGAAARQRVIEHFSLTAHVAALAGWLAR